MIHGNHLAAFPATGTHPTGWIATMNRVNAPALPQNFSVAPPHFSTQNFNTAPPLPFHPTVNSLGPVSMTSPPLPLHPTVNNLGPASMAYAQPANPAATVPNATILKQEDSQHEDLEVGMAIENRDPDSPLRWRKATVVNIIPCADETRYDVKYEDGTIAKALTRMLIRIPTLLHKVLPLICIKEELNAKSTGELPTTKNIEDKMRDLEPTALLIYVMRTPLSQVSWKYHSQLWTRDGGGFFGGTTYKKTDKEKLLVHIRKAVTSMFEDNFPGNIDKKEAKQKFLQQDVPKWVQGMLEEDNPTPEGEEGPMWFNRIYQNYKSKAKGSASVGSAPPCPSCGDREPGNRQHDWQTGADICKCGCVLQQVGKFPRWSHSMHPGVCVGRGVQESRG